MKKATDAQVLLAYSQQKSCKKAATVLGMCAQSVHERLVRLGAIESPNLFTADDDARLVRDYEGHADRGELAKLADAMGRTVPFLCRQAKRLGLTDKKRPKPYSDASHLVEGLRTNHPRGMLGKKHTDAAKAALGAKSKARWDGMTEEQVGARSMKIMRTREANGNAVQERPNASWKAGWREIGGKRNYYRSRWEANYAHYLQWLKTLGEVIDWEHEPKTFWFDGLRRGAVSYLPDFWVKEKGGAEAYHEVKGWMDDRSRVKIQRMAKHHPGVKLVVIDKAAYQAIRRKVSTVVPGWESESRVYKLAQPCQNAALL